jgi:hypothetical protein
MNRSTDCRGGDRLMRESALPLDLAVRLELMVGCETICVWIDDSGIHFRHTDGSRTEGHLPWSVAIAMSLIPADMPRVGTIEAA